MRFSGDIVVIGGGPSGLSAALYLARAGLKPLVLAGSPPGGQLMLTSEVENFPGHTSIHGQELVAKIREQAISFGAEVVDTNVKSLSSVGGVHTITTHETESPSITTKSVLIATGAKAIWLGIESEKRLRGKGVSACATCDGFFFKGKSVAIIGGGDSALEEALFLTKFASHVTVIHRRDSFRASKIMQQRILTHPKISVSWNSTVKEIIGQDKVSGILLSVDGKDKMLEVGGVFVAIGHIPDTDFLGQNILRDSKGYILTQSQIAERLYLNDPEMVNLEKSLTSLKTQKFYPSGTSVFGIFAAGDCVDRSYRQASTAAGFGVAASLDIERYLGRAH